MSKNFVRTQIEFLPTEVLLMHRWSILAINKM